MVCGVSGGSASIISVIEVASGNLVGILNLGVVSVDVVGVAGGVIRVIDARCAVNGGSGNGG